MLQLVIGTAHGYSVVGPAPDPEKMPSELHVRLSERFLTHIGDLVLALWTTPIRSGSINKQIACLKWTMFLSAIVE